MEKLNRTECKNIAKVMVASSGLAFDGFAIEDINFIDEDSKDMILKEIQNFCNKIINDMAVKLESEIDYNSCEDIVKSMYFEDL